MSISNKKFTVMVFGVFDRLHAGHLYLLKQAAKYGKVTAVVAKSISVKELKDKEPAQSEQKRMAELEKTPFVHRAILGDEKMGSYEVISKIKPDMICLGYDQKALAKDLKRYLSESELKIKIIKIKPFKPDKFHSSLL